MKKLIIFLLLLGFTAQVHAQTTYWADIALRDITTDRLITEVQIVAKFIVTRSDGGEDEEIVTINDPNAQGPGNPVYVEIELPPGVTATKLRAWYSTTNPYPVIASSGLESETSSSLNTTFYIAYDNPVIDADQDGIDDAEEALIAEKFKPVFVKTMKQPYPELQANLANPAHFIFQSQLRRNGILVTGKTEIEPLSAHWQWGVGPPFLDDSHAIQASEVTLALDKNTTFDYTGASPGSIPLFYHVYEQEPNEFVVQYWPFWNTQDVRNQAMYPNSYHEGDFEKVFIYIQKQGSTYLPTQVNLYHHDGGHTKEVQLGHGTWSTTGNIPSGVAPGYTPSRTHPVIYVASNGHALYFKDDPVYKLDVWQWSSGYDIEDYTDHVDYSVNLAGTEGIDYHLFKYDNLVKMGEVKERWHSWWHNNSAGYEVHWYTIGGDAPWNTFMGKLGLRGHQYMSMVNPPFHNGSMWTSFFNGFKGGDPVTGAFGNVPENSPWLFFLFEVMVTINWVTPQ